MKKENEKENAKENEKENKNKKEKEKFDKKLIFIVKNKDNKFGDKLLDIFYKLDISTEALKNGEALEKLTEDKKKEKKRKSQ